MADKKTILLTGGNTGIGLEACKILSSEGHKVVATVRSEEKGSYCMQEVKKYFPAADIHYMICDTSDPSSIRQFVEEFRDKHLKGGDYLDILINNAGVLPPESDKRTMCSHHPNWEVAIATNCFGPILLADLLKDDLRKAAQDQDSKSMILMVGSSVITSEWVYPYHTKVDDIMMETTFGESNLMAYKNSKVCLTLASIGLAEELADSNVAVHIMCPGAILGTELQRHKGIWEMWKLKLLTKLMFFGPWKSQSVFQGGMYIADIATHGVGNGTTGKFWVRAKLTEYPVQCQDKSKYPRMLEICRKETTAK